MKHTDTGTAGGRLRVARARKGLLQTDLAEQMGVTAGMVSFVETGRDDFSMRRWLQAADILSVSLDWLIRGIGPGPGENARKRPLDVSNEHALRPNQHRRMRLPPDDLDEPKDVQGVEAPVGVVGRHPGQVEDRQAG